MRLQMCIPALAVVALVAVMSGALAAGDPQPLAIGRPAPDFRLPGVDGKEYSLADFADAKVLAVVFTCNHCPTAQEYEGRIKQLADEYQSKGVAVVVISPNDPTALRLDELGYTDVSDSFEDMKFRAKDHAFNFPYLYDGDRQEASRAYGALATPHVFLFDRERKLRYCGRIDDSAKIARVTSHDARNAIDALLAGKPVPVEKTKVFGCSVKWSDKRPTVGEALKKWAQEEVTLEEIDRSGVAALVKNDSGKLRLINCWATWCGPCLIEFPELVSIHRSFRKREFELVTISADPVERKQQALEHLRGEHASAKNYLFVGKNEYELGETLDPKWQGPLPYTMLVAPGGKVLYRKQGELDGLELRRAIVDHLGRVYK